MSGRAPSPPLKVRHMLEGLAAQQRMLEETRIRQSARQKELAEYLAVADAVREALTRLSDQLFGDLVVLIEEQLTRALQEVLEQPIALKVVPEFKAGAMSLEFHIERGGQKEDVLRGQGGSVANVLSVGLRLLALTTLDERQHRRFLILDEQDCWLHPGLVPRLVKIVHDAGKMLGFQILMISHHDMASFERFADKIYRCRPRAAGVVVELVRVDPAATGRTDSV